MNLLTAYGNHACLSNTLANHSTNTFLHTQAVAETLGDCLFSQFAQCSLSPIRAVGGYPWLPRDIALPRLALQDVTALLEVFKRRARK